MFLQLYVTFYDAFVMIFKTFNGAS